VIKSLKKIKDSFSDLPKEFYSILQDRIKANHFSDQRFGDAVDYVIDTCLYPKPTVANFISYDKCVKTYSYEDICAMASKYGAEIFDKYPAVMLPGHTKHVRIYIDDIIKYKLNEE
jgi:hypothetical protein